MKGKTITYIILCGIITLMLTSCEILTAIFGDISSEDFKDSSTQSSQTRKATKAKQSLDNY